jgi:hypothetical protein
MVFDKMPEVAESKRRWLSQRLLPELAERYKKQGLDLEGIGAVIATRGGTLIIDKIIPGGGAQEAGLGPGDAICWEPALSDKIDWEVELAVVIGRMARRVRAEDAAAAHGSPSPRPTPSATPHGF